MNVLLVVGIAPPPIHRAGSSISTLFAELSAPPATADARKSWVRSNQLLREAVQDLAAEGAGYARGFGFIALIMASVNIFGGFLVTQRMLAMYKKKQK